MNYGNWHRRSIERTTDRQDSQPAKFNHLPLRAMTLEAGFMMAESAEIGLLMGLVGSDRSMITTWFVSPTFSRTQMNLSDSMVRLLKPTLAALIPTLVSWKEEERASNRNRSPCVRNEVEGESPPSPLGSTSTLLHKQNPRPSPFRGFFSLRLSGFDSCQCPPREKKS